MKNKTTLAEAASERARYLLAHRLGEPGVQAALDGIGEVIGEAWDGGKASVDRQVTDWAMELAGIHEPHLHTDLKLYCHEHNGTKAHPCREYYIAQVILRQCGVTLIPDEAKMIAELGRGTGIRAVLTEDGFAYADEESAETQRRHEAAAGQVQSWLDSDVAAGLIRRDGGQYQWKDYRVRRPPGQFWMSPPGRVVQVPEVTEEQAAAMVRDWQERYQPAHDTTGKPLPRTVDQMMAEMTEDDRARCIEAGVTPEEAFEGLWRRAREAAGQPPGPFSGRPELPHIMHSFLPPPGYCVPGERCPDGGKCWHECTRGCFRVRTCGPLGAAGWGDTWPEHIRRQYGETDGHL